MTWFLQCAKGFDALFSRDFVQITAVCWRRSAHATRVKKMGINGAEMLPQSTEIPFSVCILFNNTFD